jgi:HEPN domain-containing protein
MRPIASEWVAKAEGDYATLEREARARRNPNYDGASFHAQQCAEKYLKAVLSQSGIEFTKTHDLVALLEKALPVRPQWEAFRVELAFLLDFSVNYRYPGETADRESALDARRRCRLFRRAAREALRLEPGESTLPGF